MSVEQIVVTAAKYISIAAGLAAAIYCVWPAYTYLASEAVIERHYTLPSSLIKADTDDDAIKHGEHIATITGCLGCHGYNLEGRLLKTVPQFPIYAGNLRALEKDYSDGDFERAIRRGLTPDARAVWVMPSNSYAYMRDKDVEDLIAYIRSFPPEGSALPGPNFGHAARKLISDGKLAPAAPNMEGVVSPTDLGPRFEGGRYLATIACSLCHGSDLSGASDGSAPDLTVTASYTREQFFNLMRVGYAKGDKLQPAMMALSQSRFHVLHDYEIDALYLYLTARAAVPAPPPAWPPVPPTPRS